MRYTETKALARRFVEALRRGDVEAMRAMLARDFVAHGPGPLEMGVEGLAYVIEFIEGIRQATGKIETGVIEAVAVDGRTAMVWVASPRRVSSERFWPAALIDQIRKNQPFTGVRVVNETDNVTVYILRMEDGKIAEQWMVSSALLFPPG